MIDVRTAYIFFLLSMLLTHKFIYYFWFIHKPIIYSKNPLIKSLNFGTVYPHFLFSYGWLQSYYQLKRKIQVIATSRKTDFLLNVSYDAEIRILMYEPTISYPKKTTHRIFHNIFSKFWQTRIIIQLPSISEDISQKTEITENVLLIHGLNGTANSTYIKGMANVFLRKNCRVFCYNARGALHPPKSNVFSHHGLTSDVKFTIEHILSNYEGLITLVGFSLGSNWIAKLLGEYSNPRIKILIDK